MLGIRFTLAAGPQSLFRMPADDILVWWGEPARAADITIPRLPYSAWQANRPGLTIVDDTPVLFAGDEPAFLFRSGECGFDFVGSIFYLLAREEESASKEEDLLGNFAFRFSVLHNLDVLEKPLVNYYAECLRHELTLAAARKGLILEKAISWPHGKTWAVCLTHDVDIVRRNNFVFGCRNATRSIRERKFFQSARSVLGGIRDSVRYSFSSQACRFEDWLDLEDAAGARSTYYFLPYFSDRHVYDAAYKFHDRIEFRDSSHAVSEIMREMAEGGWEVALHATYKSFDNATRMAAEREAIQSTVRKAVTGIRQHFLHFKAPVTWQTQFAAGFQHDSSLGYNARLGHRAGTAFPFTVFDHEGGEELPLIELPLTIQDLVLFGHLGLELDDAVQYCISILEEAASIGGMVTVLWHPHSRSDERLWTIYKEILAFARSRNAWMASAEQISSHWQQRMEILCKAGHTCDQVPRAASA